MQKLPNNIFPLSDLELIEKYKKSKNKEIVGELFKRYSGFCFSICLKYFKNKELAQEAVLIIFGDLIDKLLIYEVSNFKSWLHSVCRNHCLLYFRNLKQEEKLFANYSNDLKIFMEKDEDFHLSSEKKEIEIEKLKNCISLIKQEQKLCVELFYLQSKSYVEIAQITGFSLQEVKSFLQNGKRNLKICMEKNERQ